jgi:hypothetical protein
MYMLQSPDDIGNVPNKAPKEAREISAFFSLVIDETIKTLPTTLNSTSIRCFRKRCTGIISSLIFLEKNEIYWECSKCRNSGTINLSSSQ